MPEVDGDAVTRLDAQVGERGREPHDVAVKLEVGERPHLSRLALPDDRRAVAGPRLEVTVEAALADTLSVVAWRRTSRAAASSRRTAVMGVRKTRGHACAPARTRAAPRPSADAAPT